MAFDKIYRTLIRNIVWGMRPFHIYVKNESDVVTWKLMNLKKTNTLIINIVYNDRIKFLFRDGQIIIWTFSNGFYF